MFKPPIKKVVKRWLEPHSSPINHVNSLNFGAKSRFVDGFGLVPQGVTLCLADVMYPFGIDN